MDDCGLCDILKPTGLYELKPIKNSDYFLHVTNRVERNFLDFSNCESVPKKGSFGVHISGLFEISSAE